MPSFKPKNMKIIEMNQKDTITLDGKHREITSKMTNDKNNVLPQLKKKKVLTIITMDNGFGLKPVNLLNLKK